MGQQSIGAGSMGKQFEMLDDIKCCPKNVVHITRLGCATGDGL